MLKSWDLQGVQNPKIGQKKGKKTKLLKWRKIEVPSKNRDYGSPPPGFGTIDQGFSLVESLHWTWASPLGLPQMLQLPA